MTREGAGIAIPGRRPPRAGEAVIRQRGERARFGKGEPPGERLDPLLADLVPRHRLLGPEPDQEEDEGRRDGGRGGGKGPRHGAGTAPAARSGCPARSGPRTVLRRRPRLPTPSPRRRPDRGGAAYHGRSPPSPRATATTPPRAPPEDPAAERAAGNTGTGSGPAPPARRRCASRGGGRGSPGRGKYPLPPTAPPRPKGPRIPDPGARRPPRASPPPPPPPGAPPPLRSAAPRPRGPRRETGGGAGRRRRRRSPTPRRTPRGRRSATTGAGGTGKGAGPAPAGG